MKKMLVTALFSTVMLAMAPVALAQSAVPAAPAPAAPAKAKPGLVYLNAADLLPQRLVAQPAAIGSVQQVQELAYLKALIANSSPERIAQARADDENETPSIYNEVMGVDLKTLPATWKLLEAVAHEADVTVDIAKVAFMRQRPWATDKTVTACTETKASKEFTSYPSGHSSIGYSIGWALVRIAPNYAPGVLSRADDYALSRQICGQHYPSDTQASRAIAIVVTERLLADPRLADAIKAAQAELNAQR